MPLREAKSIDDLYGEIREHELTLTADPPLALALDRRVDRPRLGRIGATPRGHAVNQFTPTDRRDLFRTLVTETDLSWKQATWALDRCLGCWDQTGAVESILEYSEFDSPTMRRAVETIRAAESSYRALESKQLDASRDIAVIDETALSPLDRSLLPDDYDVVPPFTGNTASIPTFHVFESATDIVSTLVDQLSATTAESVGIVLDESTVFSSLVESALETAEIPYQGGPGFIEDDTIRTFLRLAQAVFTGSDLRVAEVRPLLDRMDGDVSRERDHQRVDTVDADLGALDVFRTAVESGTLREVIAAYETATDVRLTTLRAECRALEILEQPLTEPRLNQLRYYLQSFDVPVDRDREGVLLTDGAATAYIDRPVVFYLGLGDGWANAPPDVPWIDPVEYVQRDLDRFELLLQNGQEQHFLIQDSRSGTDVTPCVYFRELFDQAFDRFSDLPHERYAKTTRQTASRAFVAPTTAEPETDSRSEVETGPDDPESVTAVSQSTLNRLANCPREEFFTRLVDTPTSIRMARGTVVHEAAELYVNAPDLVRDRFDEVVDAMVAQIRAYATTDQERIERTQLSIALETVMEYLDAHPPEPATHETYADRSQENGLADRLGIECTSPLTERWFESPEIGLRGYVDLLHTATDQIDYKTGTKKSAADHRKQASIDPLHDKPNFQAASYLSQHRRERPESEVSIHFVHVLEHVDQRARGDDPPLDEMVTTVTYLPCTFSEFVARRTVYEAVTDYADSNDRVKALEPLGYDAYRAFFESHDLPREGEDPAQREAVIEAFIAYTKERVKDTKYVERGCRAAIEDTDDLVGTYYLEPDLDAFEAFVDEQLNRLNEYRRDRFPARVTEDGPNWDCVDTPDLILTDE